MEGGNEPLAHVPDCVDACVFCVQVNPAILQESHPWAHHITAHKEESDTERLASLTSRAREDAKWILNKVRHMGIAVVAQYQLSNILVKEGYRSNRRGGRGHLGQVH